MKIGLKKRWFARNLIFSMLLAAAPAAQGEGRDGTYEPVKTSSFASALYLKKIDQAFVLIKCGVNSYLYLSRYGYTQDWSETGILDLDGDGDDDSHFEKGKDYCTDDGDCLKLGEGKIVVTSNETELFVGSKIDNGFSCRN